MPDEIEPGDLVPVLACNKCGHVAPIVGTSVDDEGQPFEEFQFQCPQCGEVQMAQQSDIKVGKAHSKQ